MPVGAIEIQKWFKGKKIVEAKRKLHIDPTIEDIKKATPNDPNKCVFSRACQREFGSRGVLFLGTVAYVDRNGVVERYVIPPKARLMIRAFDAGYKVKPTTRPEDFTLMPPATGYTRAHKRIEMRKYAASGRRKAKQGTGRKPTRYRIESARLTKMHQLTAAQA